MRKYTIKNALGHERKLYTDGSTLLVISVTPMRRITVGSETSIV